MSKKEVGFKANAKTFRDIVNCKRYSNWASILNVMLGLSIFSVSSLGICNVLEFTLPKLLHNIVSGYNMFFCLGVCLGESVLLNVIHSKAKRSARLRNYLADKIQRELLASGQFVECATFKLQRFSPIDNREVLSMSANVGRESSSERQTVSCNKKVGSYEETYRVSAGDNKTLGIVESTTIVEPIVNLFDFGSACVTTVTASKPNYSYKFIPKGDESLTPQHKFELDCYENGKSPFVEGIKVNIKNRLVKKK